MSWKHLSLVAALLLQTSLAFAGPAEPLQLKAADGVNIFALAYGADKPARASILLFHQAGASKGEYAQIAPRLAAEGFDVIAIDQRSGGEGIGGVNQTVQALGHSTGFGAALADMEAALAFASAKTPGKRVLVWGSSYSAALVFLLAAKHPGDVAALLAFSPGEYIAGQNVRSAAAGLAIPVFVTSASDGSEIAAAKAIATAVPGGRGTQFLPHEGVHGSSTLRKSANPRGYDENWNAVESFLKQAAP